MATVECRRVLPDDQAAFDRLQTRGYGSGRPAPVAPAPSLPAERPETAQAADDDGGIACFVDGEPVAGLCLRRYTTWWGQARIATESVGGVVTVPEARRRGYTDLAMLHALDDMRQRGVPLSAITTPFSYAFYRRAGWEYAFRRLGVRLPARALLPLRARAAAEGAAVRFVPWDPPAPTVPPALDAAYQAAVLQRYQGAAQRDQRLWGAHLGGERTYAYVWEGPPGETGYAIVSTRGEPVRIRELFGSGPESRRGLLAFIANFDSQSDTLAWDAPPDERIDLDVPDQNDLALRWRPTGMLRLVDVARAVEARSHDAGVAGRLALRLRDDRSSWNDGEWVLEWDAGGVRARRGAAGASAAPAAMDVRTFAQIYCGLLSAGEAAARGDAEVSVAAARLLDAAYGTGRPPLLLEWF